MNIRQVAVQFPFPVASDTTPISPNSVPLTRGDGGNRVTYTRGVRGAAYSLSSSVASRGYNSHSASCSLPTSLTKDAGCPFVEAPAQECRPFGNVTTFVDVLPGDVGLAACVIEVKADVDYVRPAVTICCTAAATVSLDDDPSDATTLALIISQFGAMRRTQFATRVPWNARSVSGSASPVRSILQIGGSPRSLLGRIPLTKMATLTSCPRQP